MTYLSLTFNCKLCAYRYMWQSIPDTNMSYIDICTIMIDIFYIGRFGILLRWHTIFGTTENVLCVAIRARATPRYFLIWKRTVGQLRQADYRGVFMLKYAFLSMDETKNPLYLDCGRSIPATHRGWKDSRLGGASSGIVYSPFVAGIDLPHQGVVDSYNI